MTIMLATDEIALYPPGEIAEDGWREPGTRPSWVGAGALQLGAGRSDPRAADGGGHGPHGPAAGESGLLFLPLDACPGDGYTAEVRGARWVLSQVRMVRDPAASGLDCWMALVTGPRSAGDG